MSELRSSDITEKKVVEQEVDEPISDNVQLLQRFSSGQLTETDAKLVFDKYDADRDGVWEREEARSFLMDVQQVFHNYRVVTDETLESVIGEMQLNVTQDGRIKWMEFKSFVLYLENYPFKYLHDKLSKAFSKDNAKTSVLVTNLDISTTSADLIKAFESAGTISSLSLVGTVGTKSHKTVSPQALIVFETADTVSSAVNTVNGKTILSSSVIVTPYSFQDFPLFGGRVQTPSWFARSYAKAILAAQGLGHSIAEFDERHKISSTIKTGAHKVGEKLSATGEAIKSTAHAAAVKTKLVAADVQDKTVEMAEDTKVKGHEAKVGAKEKAHEVKTEAQHSSIIQKGLDYVEHAKIAVASALGHHHKKDEEVEAKLAKMGYAPPHGVGTQYKEVPTVTMGNMRLVPQGVGTQYKEFPIEPSSDVSSQLEKMHLEPQGVGTQYKESGFDERSSETTFSEKHVTSVDERSEHSSKIHGEVRP